MSKPKLHARMAGMSFTEKIKVLEKLKDRSNAIASAGLRPKRGPNGGGKAGTKVIK